MMEAYKGDYMGRCNLTACNSGEPATWYHFSTQRYYCEECARMLNKENKAEAFRLYRHDLLVKIPECAADSGKREGA